MSFANIIGDTIGHLACLAAEGLGIGSSHDNHAYGPVEKICSELGWSIDERHADHVVLFFNDPLARVRKMIVVSGEKLMFLNVFSESAIPARQVPPEILGHLLLRNFETIACAWQVSLLSNGNASISLQSTMPVAGVDASMFRTVSEGMIREVHAFDSKLKTGNLL